MHRIEFKHRISYRGYPGHERNYPVVAMRVKSGEAETDILTVVDTGTELTLVSPEHAQELNIDIQSGRREFFSPTRGGDLVAWGHRVQVRIFDEVFDSEIFFPEEPIFRCLLGRDILAKTQLGLREYHGQLFLFEDSYSQT